MGLTFVEQQRSSLFYNQYEWAGHFTVSHVNLARGCTVDSLHERVNRRQMYYSNWRENNKPSAEDIIKLCDFMPVIQNLKTHSKIVFYQHWLYVYTNQFQVLSKLSQLDQVSHSEIFRATVTLDKDVIFLQQPRHPWRSYFCSGRILPESAQLLLRFFETRPQQYYVTRGFKRRLQSNCVYLNGDSFVEYQDPGDIKLLDLISPGLIRRTVAVKQTK